MRKTIIAREGPQRPPPPPPVSGSGAAFRICFDSQDGKRVAFFLDGDDVLIVEEGSVFLNRYRLDRIGNESADVEETSSGRHATVQMVAPANGNGNGDGGANQSNQ